MTEQDNRAYDKIIPFELRRLFLNGFDRTLDSVAQSEELKDYTPEQLQLFLSMYMRIIAANWGQQIQDSIHNQREHYNR